MLTKIENAPKKPKDFISKLRNIQPRIAWGGRPVRKYNPNVVQVYDHEFVMTLGAGFLYIENASAHARKTYMIENSNKDIIDITCITASRDGRHIAAIVKFKNEDPNTINIYVYTTINHMQENFTPLHIKYTSQSFIDQEEKLQALSVTFSPDGGLIGCITNIPTLGVLLFDHYKTTLFQCIQTDAVPTSISFHPTDPSKICVTGENNYVKFWRFSAKLTHAAPVVMMRRTHANFTCHAWVPPYTDATIVAGSDDGYLTVIQNCEQRVQSINVFGSSMVHDYTTDTDNNDTAVAQILVRAEYIVVASTTLVAVYEVRRSTAAKGVAGMTANLSPLARYKLNQVGCIYGLTFSLKDANTSFQLFVSTKNFVGVLDMITDYDISGGAKTKAGRERAASELGETYVAETIPWADVELEKPLFSHHSKPIQCLSASAHGSLLLTYCYHESTVRLWDYGVNSAFGANWLQESFYDNKDESPFFADIHPSGLHIAVATETEVKEYAIWDTQFDLMRSIPVRIPFKGSQGIPVVISQPVSMVKYSNGGHLIAVVTGKIVQVFHLFFKEQQHHNTENPARIMTCNDHVSPVTDVEFFRDDDGLITTAADGSVYSWKLGAKHRDKEFVRKGYSATHVTVTKSPFARTIITSFEVITSSGDNASNLPIAVEVSKKRRQSSMAMRKSFRASGSSDANSTDGNNSINNNEEGLLQNAINVFQRQKTNSVNRSSSNLLADQMNNSNNNKSFNNNAASTANSFYLNSGAGQASQVPDSQNPNTGIRSSFLAVWDEEVSPTPNIIYVEAIVKSIALGRTAGPDSFDICVIGLANGQILLSLLPLPFIVIDADKPVVPRTGMSIFTAIAVGRAKHSFRNLKRKTTLKNQNSGLSALNEGGSVASNDDDSNSITSTDMMSDTKSVSSIAASNASNSQMNLANKRQTFANSKGTKSGIQQSTRFTINEGGPTTPNLLNKSPLKEKHTFDHDTTTPSRATTANSTDEKSDEKLFVLNVNHCRILHLIRGMVTQVTITRDGLNIFAAGEDGSLFMLSTTRKYLLDQGGHISHDSVGSLGTAGTAGKMVTPDTIAADQQSDLNKLQFVMVERSKMQNLRNKLADVNLHLEQNKKDHELTVTKILENKETLYKDLDQKMRREVQKRDETILKGRNEFITLKKQSNDEIQTLKKQCTDSLSQLELMYEKKLAKEGLYLDKMKQAYDEYVAHIRLDVVDIQHKSQDKLLVMEQEKSKILQDAERQKQGVLQYFEFIKSRNDEVLQSLEEQQTEERRDLKTNIGKISSMLEEARAKNMASEVQATHNIQKLKAELESKDIEVLRIRSDLEWANDRISRLESALQQASFELKARAELGEKWEIKSGEMTKKIDDLEKVRKTLTAQLHSIRGEVVPKELELNKMSEKLQEMDREYEISLHAITEKEHTLNQKNANLAALQKQVRELRQSSSLKDAALRRAATLFHELVYAFHNTRFIPPSILQQFPDTILPGGKKVILPNSATGRPISAKKKVSTTGNANTGGNDHGDSSNADVNSKHDAGDNHTVDTATINANGTNNNANNTANKAEGENTLQNQPNDLLAQLKLEPGSNLAMRRLFDVLKPYLKEGTVDAELVEEAEAARREQERHITLLHRNFHTLKSSMDSANRAADVKVMNYLSDNQTLLKEVNSLRSEVKSLSLENQRLAAQLEFFSARTAEEQQRLQFALQFQSSSLSQLQQTPLLNNSFDSAGSAPIASAPAGDNGVTIPKRSSMLFNDSAAASTPSHNRKKSSLTNALAQAAANAANIVNNGAHMVSTPPLVAPTPVYTPTTQPTTADFQSPTTMANTNANALSMSVLPKLHGSTMKNNKKGNNKSGPFNTGSNQHILSASTPALQTSTAGSTNSRGMSRTTMKDLPIKSIDDVYKPSSNATATTAATSNTANKNKLSNNNSIASAHSNTMNDHGIIPASISSMKSAEDKIAAIVELNLQEISAAAAASKANKPVISKR